LPHDLDSDLSYQSSKTKENGLKNLNELKGGKFSRVRRIVVTVGIITATAASVAEVKLGAAPAGTPAPATRPTTGPATRPVDPNKVVLSVGESKMTAGEFEAIIATLPPDTQAMARGPARRRLAEELVKLKCLAGEARRLGLDQTARFKQQLDLLRENALAQAMMENVVSDDDLKKHYDANQKDYEKVTARHILISTAPDKGMSDAQAKAKADDLKQQLDKGGDFAALAKANSADPGSAARGGELPALPRGQLVPEFEQVAFGQAVNQISQPVKTRFGYHIIQTTRKEITPFDQVKGEIAEHLRPQRIEQVIDDLKKKAQPQIDESYFGPAPSTRPSLLPPGLGQ